MQKELNHLRLENAFLRAELTLAKAGYFRELPQDIHDAVLRKARKAILADVAEGHEVMAIDPGMLAQLRIVASDLNGHQSANESRLNRLEAEGKVMACKRNSSFEPRAFTINAETGFLMLFKAQEFYKDCFGVVVGEFFKMPK